MVDTPPPIEDRSPRLDAPRFVCQRCEAFADQSWSYLARTGYSESYLSDTVSIAKDGSGGFKRDYDGHWRTSKCASCGNLTVWRNEEIMFPRTSTIPPASKDTPEPVRALYDEGRAVWPISRRAGAALARAALEAMLRLETGAQPADKLEKLIAEASKTLPSTLGELLDVVRHAGNQSLHVQGAPDDLMVLVLDAENTEIGELIFETVNMLVDERVTKPARVSAAFDRLPTGVRARITERKGMPTGD